MIKIIIHQRLESEARSYSKIKATYKIINKQIYYFESFHENKVMLDSPFSDIDLYCNYETSHYRELQEMFNSNEDVMFFGYNNNFSKYLFWQYINEFNIDDFKIILLNPNNLRKEYILNSKDIRKAIAIYYLNYKIGREFDKEFKLVSLYEAYLFKKNEIKGKIKNRNIVEIENKIFYKKISNIYNGINIKDKTFSKDSFHRIIRTFYKLVGVKFDSALFLLRHMNVIELINSTFYEEVYKFISLKDISKVGFEEFKNILIEIGLIDMHKALRINTRELVDSYRINDPGINAVSRITKTKIIDEIAKKYYQFLMSIGHVLFYVFEEDLFSNFISSDSHYAIKTNKFAEFISEIQTYFPINLKTIEKDEAELLKAKLSKQDEFNNFNELVMNGIIENTFIKKTSYEVYKLKYLESINPELVSKEKLIQLDKLISDFSIGLVSFKDFLSETEFIQRSNSYEQ